MPMGRTLRPRLPRLSAYGQSLARSAAAYTGDRMVNAKVVEEEWPKIESPAAWMMILVFIRSTSLERIFVGNHKRLEEIDSTQLLW